ncbi:MAG: PLP-dependent aminotransferase family protein [Fuerstiella sp.]
MNTTATGFQPAIMARRASEQAIGFLIQQGLENADCLSLAAGFVDLQTLPVQLVKDASAKLLADAACGKRILQYGTTAGPEELRSVFRDYLAELEDHSDKATNLPLGQIMLTTGSQQLLALASQAIFDEGDICLVAAPTYFVYLGVLDGVGANTIPVKTDSDGMCPEALDAMLQQLADDGQLHKVKMVYVVSYHDNPAGISLSNERRPRLMEVVKKWSRDHHIYILEDAAYRELQYDGPDMPSLWSFDDAASNGGREHVILALTFSKSFSPGVRVGMGVLPQELIKPVSDLKGNEDFGSTHLSQNIVAEVLKQGTYRTHVTGLLKSYQLKRDAMLAAAEEFFSDIDGVSWLRPNGGLYVWMSLPESIETGFKSALFERATSVDKVMYVPGELCYPSAWKERPKNQMRLSFGVLNPEDIRESMKRLAAAVKSVAAKQA